MHVWKWSEFLVTYYRWLSARLQCLHCWHWRYYSVGLNHRYVHEKMSTIGLYVKICITTLQCIITGLVKNRCDSGPPFTKPYWWFSERLQSIVNSLAPGKFEWDFRHVIFKQILVIDDWGISCEIALTWKPQRLTDDVNIGSGNGLVPSGNKPLPEPILTQFSRSVAIWRH